MNELYIGGIGSGKTPNLKKRINEISGKVIVLDYNDEYDDFSENQICLDKVNPILGEINLLDVRAINSGYIHDSQCLFKICEEIMKESEEYKKLLSKYDGDSENESLIQELMTMSREGLVEEGIERLQTSWSQTENAYAKILTQKIPLKKNRAQTSIDKTIKDMADSEHIVLKAKGMHSDHIRAVSFALISKLSRALDEPIYIVVDKLSGLFNQRGTKFFLKTIDPTKVKFICSYNKLNNVSKELLDTFEVFYLHGSIDKADVETLKGLGIEAKKDVKKFKVGEFEKVEKNSVTPLAIN